jgi:hypothetical protein
LQFQNQEKFANIWLVLTIQTVMPVGFTNLLLYAANKQKNQCNGASHFKEECLRKAQHYQSTLKEKKALCNLNLLTLPPNNHNLFCEIGLKQGAGEKRKNL